MLVVQIKRDVLEKSRNGGKLVPVKKTVTRGGKAFQMTFWVDPAEKKTGGAAQRSLFDIADLEGPAASGSKGSGSEPVKNGTTFEYGGDKKVVKFNYSLSGQRVGVYGSKDNYNSPEYAVYANGDITVDQLKAGLSKKGIDFGTPPAKPASNKFSDILKDKYGLEFPKDELSAYLDVNKIPIRASDQAAFDVYNNLRMKLSHVTRDGTCEIGVKDIDAEIKKLEKHLADQAKTVGKGTNTYEAGQAKLAELRGVKQLIENGENPEYSNEDVQARRDGKKPVRPNGSSQKTAEDMNREVAEKRAKENEGQVRARGTKIERKEPGSTKWEFMAETSTPEIAASLVEMMNSGDNGINDQAKQAADLLADHGLIIRKGSQISYSKVSDMVKELEAAGKIPDSMKEELAREYVGSRIKSIEAFKRRAGHGNHTDNAAKKGMMDDIKNGNYDKYVSTAFASSMQGFLQQTDTRLPYHPEDYSHEIKSWAQLANTVAPLVIEYLHDKKDESAETHRIAKSIGPVGMFVQGWLRGKR